MRKSSHDAQPILKSTTTDTVEDFRKSMFSHIETHLTDFIDEQSEEELSEYIEYYNNALGRVHTKACT